LQDEVENVKQRLAQTKNEKDNLESILLEEATLRIRERIKAAKAEAAAHVTASAPAAPVKTVESREREREPKEIRYVVRQGDTLQSIAERYYGATKFWDEIYQANKDSVGRGGVLKPTQVLIIPAVSKQDPSVELPLQARSAQKAESAIEAPKIKTETPKPETPTASGEKIIPIKVLNTPGGVTPVVLPGLAAEKITPVTGEFERTVQKKKDMPRPVLAKAKSAISRRHLVQPGENLRSIAQKYYNDSNRWKEIYQANRDKVISGQVAPGQEIVIP
jgi:nucleoid-associated protein YgaU